jgi:signal transduction histidine kinase
MLPLLSVAILAAVAVAVISYWLGDRWAQQQTASRYAAISQSLAEPTFPLTPAIVRLLADLTETELITLTGNSQIVASSLDLTGNDSLNPLLDNLQAASGKEANQAKRSLTESITISGRSYRIAMFDRRGIRPEADQANRVAVLFAEDALRATRIRAAGLPLVTGLSTILLLASVTLSLAGRLVGRLTKLQRQVDRIAEGDFEGAIEEGPRDEIGRLGSAVKHMRGQLKQMWQTLQRQQGSKLLHQIAGGLAHQLRNSITGARMAVELHQRRCDHDDDGGLSVALGQLEQTEDYVRRLLLVAAGQQDEDRPGSVSTCLQDIQSNLAATADHLRVTLHWHVSDETSGHQVRDTPSLAAAVTNLVLNAMQAASDVEVRVNLDRPDRLRIEVVDNGPGPSQDVSEQIFEPFVTSKPEGLGLGLPLVKRSAERLGGRVEWDRDLGKTRFVLWAATS